MFGLPAVKGQDLQKATKGVDYTLYVHTSKNYAARATLRLVKQTFVTHNKSQS